MGNRLRRAEERPRHGIDLPLTFALYTRLLGDWRGHATITRDIKSLWRCMHQDLEKYDERRSTNGDFQ